MLRFLSQFLLSLLLGAWLVSCSSDQKAPQATAPTENAPQRLRDDLGREVIVPAQPRRILALSPSMTEMLYAVADTANIIGRTQNCDFPQAVLRKPVVNTYPLDMEGVVALRPDVVFTVNDITSLDDATRLQQLGIQVYYQRYTTVPDVLRGLRDLGRILHRESQARRLTDSLAAELKQLEQQAPINPRPKVLAVIWQDPIYVWGQNTLFTDKIRRAGGQNAVVEKFPQPSLALTREYVLQLNPDVLLGGSFGKLDSTFFKNYPELRRIRAYQTRQVYGVNGDLMARPSPRVVESVRELQGLLRKSPARL